MIGQNSLAEVQDMITRLGEFYFYWIALTISAHSCMATHSWLVQAKYRLSSMQITTSAS